MASASPQRSQCDWPTGGDTDHWWSEESEGGRSRSSYSGHSEQFFLPCGTKGFN